MKGPQYSGLVLLVKGELILPSFPHSNGRLLVEGIYFFRRRRNNKVKERKKSKKKDKTHLPKDVFDDYFVIGICPVECFLFAKHVS